MSKVNVLCAPPNGKNPGMASVDLAFERVAATLGAESTYWRLWDQSEWIEPPGGSTPTEDGSWMDELTGLAYRPARGHLDEFLDADAVVFWGDFHHMAVYIEQTTDVLHRRMGAMNRSEAQTLAEQHLLLVDQDHDILRRTLTFGTTLAFNSPRDYSHPYGQHLANFLGGIHGAWFRDGYSARVAELLRAPRSESCLGSDAAFLTPGAIHDPNRASGIGVFVGRSSSATPEAIGRIGRIIASCLDEDPTWLPWGEQPAMWPMWGRKRLRLAWPQLEGVEPVALRERISHARAVATTELSHPLVPTSAELSARIAAHRLILTDTYHLAVNAWRIGTPAILLYERPRGSGWNVNSGTGAGRDKRHDLYSQLDALQLLLDIHERLEPTDLAKAVSEAADEEFRRQTHQRATQIGDHALARFSASLNSLLNP